MDFRVTVMPGGEHFQAAPGQTLLHAALEAGFFPSHQCRSGACGSCKSHLVSGRVDHGAALLTTLTPEERARGLFLYCCATPLSDVAIERGSVELPGEIRFKRLTARIREKQVLSDDGLRVALELPLSRRLLFMPGHGIGILHPDGTRSLFELRNAPGVGHVLEIEVARHRDERAWARFQALRCGQSVSLEGPVSLAGT